jgi:hypothetical protein
VSDPKTFLRFLLPIFFYITFFLLEYWNTGIDTPNAPLSGPTAKNNNQALVPSFEW